jgi:hypothetical protein
MELVLRQIFGKNNLGELKLTEDKEAMVGLIIDTVNLIVNLTFRFKSDSAETDRIEQVGEIEERNEGERKEGLESGEIGMDERKE